ncbi:hypothetical protein [Lacticaseibacillus paracasei]|uniref:hypothetical protein n=1 Tax=Lacticaseibacillus paracasei TaxID=1597 RepID=UPI001CDB5F07|nr:hypothetical protein [Lacticaseibacillus paracasei]
MAVTLNLGDDFDTAITQQISAAINLALSNQNKIQSYKEWMSLGDAAKYLVAA